jgi:GNAT superfamily N-acetyltransferase
MTPLRPSQVDRAAAVFAAALADDPLYLHFFPDARTRRRCLTELYRFRLATERERVRCTSDGLEGCALWIPPGGGTGRQPPGVTVTAVIRLVRSIPWPAILRMWRYHRFALRLHESLLPAAHWYLDVVVVAPEQQGRGFASGLIRPTLERASRDRVPCFLETQNPANVALYRRFGFEVAARVRVPGTSLMHVAMVRPP